MPEFILVKLIAVDLDRHAAGTGDFDAQIAHEAGTAAGDIAAVALQNGFDALLGHAVAVTGIQRRPFIQRLAPFKLGQFTPVLLPFGHQIAVQPLRRQINPDIGFGAVDLHALALPQHFRDHGLRGLVGVIGTFAELTHGFFVIAFAVAFHAQHAAIKIRMAAQKAA